MRPKQAAKTLNVSLATVYRWIGAGLIDSVKMVGTVHIPDEAVERAKVCGIQVADSSFVAIPKIRSRVRSKGRSPWKK